MFQVQINHTQVSILKRAIRDSHSGERNTEINMEYLSQECEKVCTCQELAC